MKTHRIAVVAGCVTLLFAVADEAPREASDSSLASVKSSYESLRSVGGYIAHYLRFTNEDQDLEGRLFIERDGVVVAVVNGVRPVLFSPTEDVLLVREDIADDDLKHFLLDIGAGQFSRTEERASYVFGSRFVDRVEWSDDGKHIVTFDYEGTTGAAPSVVSVAEMLGERAPREEK